MINLLSQTLLYVVDTSRTTCIYVYIYVVYTYVYIYIYICIYICCRHTSYNIIICWRHTPYNVYICVYICCLYVYIYVYIYIYIYICTYVYIYVVDTPRTTLLYVVDTPRTEFETQYIFICMSYVIFHRNILVFKRVVLSLIHDKPVILYVIICCRHTPCNVYICIYTCL